MKILWIVLPVVIAIVIGVVVFFIFKKKKESALNATSGATESPKLNPNISKTDLKFLFDAWAAAGYPGTFEQFANS